jgi:hypothetical protein
VLLLFHFCQAALEIFGDYRAARATRCILLGLTGNHRLAVEDAVVLQGSSTTFVIKTLMRAREAALGRAMAAGANSGGGFGSPSCGLRATVRLIKAITMIQEGAIRVSQFSNFAFNL